MKFYTTLFIGIIGATALFLLNFQLPSQESSNERSLERAPFEAKNTDGWFKAKEGQQFTTAQLLNDYTKILGFSPYDKLELNKSETDELGITHHRYDQYHRGIRIADGQFLVHEKDGFVQTFNGKWIKNMDLLASPNLSPNQAIQKGLQLMSADIYTWEDAQMERDHKENMDDPSATLYPNAELIWLDPSYSQNKENLSLVYKFAISALVPYQAKTYFIDAQTGDLILEQNLILHANSVGTAKTRYSGEQTIITDSLDVDNFRLRENNRPSPIGPDLDIITLNAYGQTNLSNSTDFIDFNNYWDNVNGIRDEYAPDCHWAMEKTFDFMIEKLNWNGINNGNLNYRSYVHFDNNHTSPQGLLNAMWNGGQGHAVFGDGSDFTIHRPLTPIDVVAHEFGHGVIQYTNNLIYAREPGALNESFADLFGIAIENWAKPADANWLIGEEFHTNGDYFRNMADPNDKGDPDTYGGDNWINPDCDIANDNDGCGVHTNSGVQNKWYYIMVEGESGTNDLGNDYDVTGIGADLALSIAFRNLRFYLTESSKFADAMEGAVQAAEDIHGKCSEEYVATVNAWYAVGLGDGLFESDIELTDIKNYSNENCGLEAEEFPTFDITYQSCLPTLTVGTEIPFYAQVDNGPITEEIVTLSSVVLGFQTVPITFTKPVLGLDAAGPHEIKIWTTFDLDPNTGNDTISMMLENIIEQESDFGGFETPNPPSSCFLNTQKVSANFVFLGCDFLGSGSELDFYYSFNGGTPVKETSILTANLFRYGTFTYDFDTPVTLTGEYGKNNFDFWVDFKDDFLNGNDTIFGLTNTRPYLLTSEQILTFEADDVSLDSAYLVSGEFTDAYPSTDNDFAQENIVEMTGGNFDMSGAKIPNANNVWDEDNESLSAMTCVCVDARSLGQVDLKFDLKQSTCREWQISHGALNFFGSACRVLVDGEQVGPSFFPETLASDDPVNHTINLDEFAYTFFEVCFESRCGYDAEYDSFNKGDLVKLDNIEILGLSTNTRDLDQIAGLSVAPNPSNGQLTINYDKEINTLEMDVFDIYGRMVESFSNAQINRQLDLTNLVTGTYYLRFQDGQEQHIEKIVIAK